MRTLDRYISGIFLKNFLLSLLSLTFIFLFQGLLGELIDGDYPASQLVYYHLLQLPHSLLQMAPPSVLAATVFTVSGLNRTNELVAYFSIGIGLERIMLILLSLVFMICCLLLVLQDRIIPPVHKNRTNYYWHVMKNRPDFFLDVKQNKIWYRSKNLIYNLRTFDVKNKTIRGMTVYTFDPQFNLKNVVAAEKATYTPEGWKLLNGTETSFSRTDPFPKTRSFEYRNLLLDESPQDFQEIEREVDGLRLKELYRYIQRTKESGTDTKSYEVKFHSRISMSFIPLVMCLLGFPFSYRNRREGSIAKDLGICLVVTFFYWLFYSVGLSLGSNGALPPVLAAWVPSAAFAGLALFLLSSRSVTT